MNPAVWTFLGVVGAGGIAGLVSFGVAWLNKKPVQQSADVAGLTASNGQWEKLAQHYSAKLDAAETRLGAVEKKVTDLTTAHAGMATRLREVEDDRDALAEAAADLARWEDAGRPTPPGAPQLPQRIRTILARMHSED